MNWPTSSRAAKGRTDLVLGACTLWRARAENGHDLDGYALWLPVLDQLSVDRRVLALDFPGHGQTSAPGADVEFDLPWLVAELGLELRRLGINGPVDLVSNSLGGLVALGAAKRGLASSGVALSPAGLWHTGMPLPLRLLFRTGLLTAWLTGTRAGALLGL